MVAKTDVAKKVINLLDHKEPDIQVAALDILGNIASGTNDYTQYILDIGTLPLMDKFLKSSNKKRNKVACWFLTNFLAGSEEQIQAVFDAGYIPLIIKHLKTVDFVTQQKAAKCVFNIAVYGNYENLNTIIDRNVLPALSSFLKVVEDKETKIIELALQGLEKIVLNSPTRKNEMFDQLLENGGIDVLQRLQKYPSDAVSFFSDSYFGLSCCYV
uniref:Uncharacterized protein n=1 Tax=Panagrolaimus sp. PS1159 TaxID=55785 RepID=A0AC35EUR0_9BILA